MAIKVKGESDAGQQQLGTMPAQPGQQTAGLTAQPAAPAVRAVPASTEPAPKPASEFIAELELERPLQNGETKLRFRRLNFGAMRAVLEEDKITGKIALFLEAATEPKLGRSDIEGMAADDVQECWKVLDMVIGRDTPDDDNAEASVYDDSMIAKGRWDPEEMVFTLGYPIGGKGGGSSPFVIDKLHFIRGVSFKEAAIFLNSTNTFVTIREFIRVYARPAPGIEVAWVPTIIDSLDASDALQINREVRPAVAGKSKKQSRLKRL